MKNKKNNNNDNYKSIFYIATLVFCGLIPVVAMVLWVMALKKAINNIDIYYFIFLMACPLIFGFFSFMFPIIRKITVNHFKRVELQKEIEFDLQMEQLQIEKRTLNQALQYLTSEQQQEITNFKLQQLKETENLNNHSSNLKTTSNLKKKKIIIKK